MITRAAKTDLNLIVAAALASTLCLIFGASSGGAADAPVLVPSPGQTLSLSVGDNVRVASVTREGLSSDGLTLRSFPDHIRGEVGAEPLELLLEPRRLEGTLGHHPVALDVWRSGDRLQIAGNFGARAIALEVRPHGVRGQVGPCRYNLTLAVTDYRGDLTCGGPSESVELKVPVALVARDDRETAAMLTALLAR